MTKNIANEILEYNKKQTENDGEICEFLMDKINKTLKHATSKLYHGSPVWFLNENPLVGYNTSKDVVQVLFWSGQSFDEPELVPVGKYKAARLSFQDTKDIDEKLLNRCLKKSQTIMWNYKDIVKNKGKLSLIDLD